MYFEILMYIIYFESQLRQSRVVYSVFNNIEKDFLKCLGLINSLLFWDTSATACRWFMCDP